MDRAGIVGEDGPTQHGVFDIAFMRAIPNMKVMAPKDENELRHMLYTALYMDGPVSLRYPRGKGIGVPVDSDLHTLEIGKAELLRPATLELAERHEWATLRFCSTVDSSRGAAKEVAGACCSVAVCNSQFS